MNLHEEFKLFEEMWETADDRTDIEVTDDGQIQINCTKLTEGVTDWFRDFFEAGGKIIFAKLLKYVKSLDQTRVTPLLIEMLEIGGRDSFGELELPPVSLNKHRIAAMMSDDLDRLSAREWAKKWYTGFLQNGNLGINPEDYPDIDLVALTKVKSGTYKR